MHKGPEEQGIVRQARTVCRPDIAPVWVSTLEEIIDYLDSVGVEFNSINPLGWANEGEKDPFCAFLLGRREAPFPRLQARRLRCRTASRRSSARTASPRSRLPSSRRPSCAWAGPHSSRLTRSPTPVPKVPQAVQRAPRPPHRVAENALPRGYGWAVPQARQHGRRRRAADVRPRRPPAPRLPRQQGA